MLNNPPLLFHVLCVQTNDLVLWLMQKQNLTLDHWWVLIYMWGFQSGIIIYIFCIKCLASVNEHLLSLRSLVAYHLFKLHFHSWWEHVQFLYIVLFPSLLTGRLESMSRLDDSKTKPVPWLEPLISYLLRSETAFSHFTCISQTLCWNTSHSSLQTISLWASKLIIYSTISRCRAFFTLTLFYSLFIVLLCRGAMHVAGDYDLRLCSEPAIVSTEAFSQLMSWRTAKTDG